MDYLYELDIWKGTRHIRATYTGNKDDVGAFDFQPMDFTPEELDADWYQGFLPSRLETLVVLFTGEDPAMKLLKASSGCTHEGEDDCDCPPVSVDIPAVLAYHAIALSQSLGNFGVEFYQHPTARDSNRIVRRYRLPTGEIVHESRNINERNPPSKIWDEYPYWLNQERSKILDGWYQQGIALHRS